MIQVLMIVHVLLGVGLLGAITHQAFSVGRTGGTAKQTVVDRFRGVHAPAFINTVIVLFVLSSLAGGLLYPRYRIDVRTTLEDLQLRAANGLFEIKEHFAAVGLGVLPAYWLSWRTPLAPDYAATRKYLTWLLAFLVWWNFLVGEILNNIKGLFP
jgi:hypothetical protein